MAYFAKLGVGNKVEKVELVSDTIATTEQAGIDFLNNLYKTNDIWKQTFIDGSQRKNFVGVGYKYNQSRDAFISPTPFYSWALNESTCTWEPPFAKPELTEEQIENKNFYKWNELNQTWDLF